MSIIDGDQIPIIPLFDVEDKLGAGLPLQTVGISLNVGVMTLFIVIVIVIVELHDPGVGVKV